MSQRIFNLDTFDLVINYCSFFSWASSIVISS